MMIDVNKLKEGVTFLDGGEPFKVIKYSFSKMGRGKANIKLKARNLETGAIVTKSFLSGNSVEEINLDKQQLQYLYQDGETLHFMHPVSFEQYEIDRDVLGEDLNYLVEGEKAWVLFWEEKVLGVELPASVVLEVVEAAPGEKGNSATNVLKPVKMNSGLMVQVPTFIKEGDKLKINIQTGEYINRVNK